HGRGLLAVDVLAVAGTAKAQEIAAHRHFGDTDDAAAGPNGRDHHRTHGGAVETTLEPLATRHLHSGRGCCLGVELANFIHRAGAILRASRSSVASMTPSCPAAVGVLPSTNNAGICVSAPPPAARHVYAKPFSRRDAADDRARVPGGALR